MQSRKTCLFSFLTKIIEGFFGSFQPIETFNQITNAENGIYWFVVNSIIIGHLKVMMNSPVDHEFVVVPIHSALPDHGVGFVAEMVPHIAGNIMVGPHQIEFHLSIIFGF
jgi:hypothetical protein